LARIAGAAARFLFPSPCIACEKGSLDRILEGGVCANCWSRLPKLAPARCGRCILDPPSFASLRGVAPYRGSAREILLAFKFRGADYLAPRLARLMKERLPPEEAPQEVTAVPPTARSRWRQD